MSGHRPFSELTKRFTPEQRARIDEKKAALRAEMALHELRQARRITQAQLARTLSVGQPSIAKMEKRADVYVSNLRTYIEAMGGELQIIARFPDGAVEITNFNEIGDPEPEAEPGAGKTA